MTQNIGVAIVVMDEEGRIVVGKRKNSYKAGWYGLPGGRVEPGEKLAEAAQRELKEETGLIARKLTYIGLVKEFQETYDFIHFGFICTSWRGKPECREPDKCDGWEWIENRDAETQLLPGHAAVLKLVGTASPLIEI